MHGELVRLTEKNAYDLRQDDKLTGCLTIKIRYADFDTQTKQVAIAYTALDHILVAKAKEIFDRLYDRRQRVRLIGVRLSKLVPGNYQINLFDDTSEMISLYQSVDVLKHKFGSKSISRAATAIALVDEKGMLTEQDESYLQKEQKRKAATKARQQEIRAELKKKYTEKRRIQKEEDQVKAIAYEEDVFMPVCKKNKG